MALARGGISGVDNAASQTSVSVSGSDVIGIVDVVGETTDQITAITWGGVSMTKIGARAPSGDRFLSSWYIVNPASGTSTIAFTGGSFWRAVSSFYTDADTIQPDSFADNTSSSSTSIAVTTTVVAANCWLHMFQKDGQGGNTYSSSPGTVLYDGDAGGIAIADSNGTVSTGSEMMTMTQTSGSGSNHAAIMFSIAPKVASAPEDWIYAAVALKPSGRVVGTPGFGIDINGGTNGNGVVIYQGTSPEALSKGAFLDLNALTAERDFTFPDESGTFALTSDIVPTTPDTSIQFNNSGSFGGSSQLLYDTVNATIILSRTSGSPQILGVANGSSDGIALRGGDASVSNLNGGAISIFSGAGDGSGNGGTSSMIGGTAGATGIGGGATFNGGLGGSTSGAGGSVNLTAGSAQAGDSNGGDVSIFAGGESGSGLAGTVTLSTNNSSSRVVVAAGGITLAPGLDVGVFIPNGAGTVAAQLDTSLLSSSNKTFQFPDQSGIFALVSDLPAGSALTEVDDTNVTLTLAGSPTTALLNATSITAGWTGTLAPSRGGTGASSLLGAGIVTTTDTEALTTKATDIADTALTTTGAGLYRVSYYLLDTTADLTAGAVTLNIKFTDAATARTLSSAPVVLTATTGFAQGQMVVQLASGGITYGVTHTGIFGTAVYALYLSLERLV